MKTKNLLISIFLTLLLIANIFIPVVHADSDITFEVVEENVCRIDFSDTAYFEKKLVDKDLDKHQVTIELKVVNNAEEIKPTGELMIVLDNSNSMNDQYDGTTTRYNAIVNSANTLIDKLLTDNDNLKIGVVSFSSKEGETITDTSKEGTLEDANLVSTLTDDASELKTAIQNIPFNGYRTDLDAGITIAKDCYTSEENNKYMIILTDGVPNIALNWDKNYYSDDAINKTKAKLSSLSDISVITMLTGIGDDVDATPGIVSKTYGEIIEEIFGTTENPTIGKFYYIDDDEIEKTITTDIYNDLKPQSKTISNIQITDYFPKEIIDNFNFAYVSSPNIGNISAVVDTTTNSITWTIDELKSGETATVRYTLTLKNDFDSSIIDKILDTNDHVDLTYDDDGGKSHTETSDETPKVKITTKDIPDNNTTNNTTNNTVNNTTNNTVNRTTNNLNKDNTIATTILPKTGSQVLVFAIFTISAIAAILIARYKKLNNDMK